MFRQNSFPEISIWQRLFVHKLQEKEMWRKLRPNKAKKDEIIQKNLLELVEENKKREETDNITAIAIRVEP